MIRWKLSKENWRKEKENTQEIEPHVVEVEVLDEKDLVHLHDRDHTLLQSHGQDLLHAVPPDLLGQGQEHPFLVAQERDPILLHDQDLGLKLVLILDLVHELEPSLHDLDLVLEQSPGLDEGLTQEKEFVLLVQEVDLVLLLPRTTTTGTHLIEM